MQQLYHGHDPSPARDTLSSLSRAGEYLEVSVSFAIVRSWMDRESWHLKLDKLL